MVETLNYPILVSKLACSTKSYPSEIKVNEFLQVCQILEIDESELEERFLTKNTKHLRDFKLKPRGLHVFGGKNVF